MCMFRVYLHGQANAEYMFQLYMYTQVEVACLLSQCMADEARWEEGQRLCEDAMSLLPAAKHLAVSTWKVSIVSV